MSMRYKGGVISATPPTTSASSAVGVWTLEQQLQATAGSGWPSYPPYFIGTLTSGSSITSGSAVSDTSENIYLTGANNIGGTALYFQKLNVSGVIQFQKQLQTFASGVDIAIDSSSNLYIANNTGDTGIGIVKYNSSGVLQWQRQLAPAFNPNRIRGIAVDGSNNVYVVGTAVIDASGRNDIVLAKYDTNGNIQWQRSLNASTNNCEGNSIRVSSAGNVYIVGVAVPGSTYDMFVAKYNTSGTIQWQRTIDASSSSEWGRSVAIDSSENVYVIGQGYSPAYSFVMVKLNTSGTLQWSRTLSSAESKDGTYGAAVDSSNNIYFIGINYTTPRTLVLAKYDASGTIQWQRSFTNIQGGNSYNKLKINNTGAVLFSIDVSVSTITSQLEVLVPANGSKTGTYSIGSFSTTYAASSLTDASASFAATASSLTASTSSLTDSATSLTESNTSFTQTTTLI